MNTQADKSQDNKKQSVSAADSLKQSGTESALQFVDNRPEALAQRKMQEMADHRPERVAQRKLQEIADKSQGLGQLRTINPTGGTIQLIPEKERKAADQKRRKDQEAAAEAARQTAKKTPEAVKEASAAQSAREASAAEAAKKKKATEEKESRRKALLPANNNLITVARDKVLTARKTKGQERFNAGKNKGISDIEGGTDNPIALNKGTDNFALMEVASSLINSDSGTAKRVFPDGNNPNILIHVT